MKGKWPVIVSIFIAKFKLFIEAMNMVPTHKCFVHWLGIKEVGRSGVGEWEHQHFYTL